MLIVPLNMPPLFKPGGHIYFWFQEVEKEEIEPISRSAARN